MIILLQLFAVAALLITPRIHGDASHQIQTVIDDPSSDSFDVDLDKIHGAITLVSETEESYVDSLSCPSVELILDDIEKLNVENTYLKAQVDTLNSVISEQAALIRRLTDESSISSSIPPVISDCSDHKILLVTYQQQIANLTTYSDSLQAQLLSASKNVSMLEIKLSLEKNEKVIARLSRDNCMLELTNLKDVQDDDLSAARQEAILLRSQLVSSEQSYDLCRKRTTQQCDRRAAVPVNGTQCDVASCLEHFLTSYTSQWFQANTTHNSAASSAEATDAPPSNPTEESHAQTGPSLYSYYLQSLIDSARLHSFSTIVITQLELLWSQLLQLYWSVIHPNLVAYCSFMLGLQWTIVSSILTFCQSLSTELLKVSNKLSPIFAAFYNTNIHPFLRDSAYPVYEQHVHPWLSSIYTSSEQWYSEHLATHVTQFIVTPYEEVIDIMHRLLYYSVEFFFREDLYDRFIFFLENVWEAVRRLSSAPPLVASFGDSSIYIIVAILGIAVLWILYWARRVLLGIIAAVLIVFLCPVLFVLFVTAKLVSGCISLFSNAPTKRKVRKGKVGRDHSSRPQTTSVQR